MKHFVLFLLLFMPFSALASEKYDINTPFLDKEYCEEEKDKFEKEKIFKTLDFLYKEKKDGIDLHIKTEERTYILPMFFAFNSTKRSGGISVLSGNLFKKGEEIFVSLGSSRETFYSQNEFFLGKNTFSLDYTKLNYNQNFYEDGWSSLPGIFTSADNTAKHPNTFIGKIRTKEEELSFSYTRKISNLWQFSITPEYQYYLYQNHLLDSGNHSNISFALKYADDININTDMNTLEKVSSNKKEYILKDLNHIKNGKLVKLSYTYGSNLTASDYKIQKLSLSSAYLLEFKKHNRLALFAKAAHAFQAPFSNQIVSSDLLFGLGIYDRQQRGKSGFSFGTSFTYLILRNQTGILSLIPFYEQAYVNSQNNDYTPHSGIGLILTYQIWNLHLPISLNFTHNLNDSKQHFGIKIGGRF